MPALESAPAANNLSLSLTRVIHAPRPRVYAAWTNPEMLMAWFGPVGIQCTNAQVDLRVGGEYRLDMFNPSDGARAKGTTHVHAQGKYTKIVPDELLEFTWVPCMSPDENTLVTITLKDVEGGTEVTLRHDRFSYEQSRDGHNQGWTGCFEKLEAYATTL